LSLRRIESSRTQGKGLMPRAAASSRDMCACPPAALTLKRRAQAIQAIVSLHAPCTLVTQRHAGRHEALKTVFLAPLASKWCSLTPLLAPCPRLCTWATGAQERSRLSQHHLETSRAQGYELKPWAAMSSSVVSACLLQRWPSSDWPLPVLRAGRCARHARSRHTILSDDAER
jgi:hypothetical protein